MKIGTCVFLSICFMMVSCTLSGQSVEDIMVKYDYALRKTYFSLIQKNILSTSKFAIEKDRLVYVGKSRLVVVESVRKLVSEVSQDFYSLISVLDPISDKGIGLLYYEYFDSQKENDNWMYLPALGKVKRIISSTNESDDSGNFLGTEFCTEDMQIRKVVDYTYKITGETTIENRPTWIIEMIPTSARMPKTKYGKIVTWIDKERFLSIKEELYDHKGNLYKQHLYKNFELVNDIWTARNSAMINFSNHRVTNNEVKYVGHNFKIFDDFFAQRTFTDFAYREKNMDAFRKYWK